MDIPTFLHDITLDEQPEGFQKWFNENVLPQINFVDSCITRDEFNRPLSWQIENITIKASYFTQNENYNFNQFIIL